MILDIDVDSRWIIFWNWRYRTRFEKAGL